MSALDHIYATSGTESAATALAQAPEFLRALRDIRERDFEYFAPSDARRGQPDRIVLHEGEIVRLTRSGFLEIDGTRWVYRRDKCREYQDDQFAAEPMLERLWGDEHTEQLLRLGGWELEDGCTVTISREDGIKVDYSTRRGA